MNPEFSVLISYVEEETSSIFYQELVDLSQIEGEDYFSDVKENYEIELSPDEWYDPESLPIPLTSRGNLTLSSIRLRKVPGGYRQMDVPSGGELFSLLHGDKGLAAFSMRKEDDETIILDGQEFAKFVTNGVISKRVFNIEVDGYAITYLLFYFIDQVWRADVYEQLKRHLARASWTKYLDRIESIILGYDAPES